MLDFALEVPLPIGTLSSWSRGVLNDYLQSESANIAEARDIWQCLIKSLASPTTFEKQRTSICNCLRVFLKSTMVARNTEIQSLPLDPNQWIRCYEAVLSVWHKAKVKPLLQVLEVSLQIAKERMPAGELDSIWRKISVELSIIILSGQPIQDLKRALALSSFFLEKGLPYQVYIESIQQNVHLGSDPRKAEGGMDARTMLIYAVLQSFNQHEAKTSSEKLFKSVLKASTHHVTDIKPWWALVKSFVANHTDSLDAIAQSIFPLLLQQHTSSYLTVLSSPGLPENKGDLLFSLAVLQTLREQELIDEKALLDALRQRLAGTNSVDRDAVDLLLSHDDESVRLRTLRLLATSKLTKNPISMPVLQYLDRTLHLWFRPGGSHERGGTLGVIRRLLVRLRGGSSALKLTSSSSPINKQLLEAHEAFAQKLIVTSVEELFPNASYQRRIMGLSVFRYLLESKIDLCDRNNDNSNDSIWPFAMCLRQGTYVQTLLHLMSDAYEDIRTLSAHILRYFIMVESPACKSDSFIGQLEAAVRALVLRMEEKAAQTNRSDHADGLGRLYALLALKSNGAQIAASGAWIGISISDQLVSRLELMLDSRTTFSTSENEPLHGLLLGVMYCIIENSSTDFDDRIIVICWLIWRAVASRLCVDSPETADEDADHTEEFPTGPKDMLSYCWRALRDSSLLLRALLNKSRSVHSQQRLITVRAIGDLCVEQLTTLRHRGAFSTVAQTFTICCECMISIEGDALAGHRLWWYREAEAQVTLQADRLTRRSAGLPAMVASILSPDDDSSFRSFIDIFIAKSCEKVNSQTQQSIPQALPQVHAMNTLREVMINSRFREAILPHLQSLLILATQGMGSNTWAVRNCGLMLCRACITRLPQGDSGQLEASSHHGVSSDPFDVALGLLRDGLPLTTRGNRNLVSMCSQTHEGKNNTSLQAIEQSFAALDIVAHIHPTTAPEHEIRIFLRGLLGSSVWPMRQRAAEVLASLTPKENLLADFYETINRIATEGQQNRIHGHLLFCQELLRAWFSNSGKLTVLSSLEKLGQQLVKLKNQLRDQVFAPPAAAAIFDIANYTLEQCLRFGVHISTVVAEHEKLFPPSSFNGFYLVDRSILYNVALKLIALQKVVSDKHKLLSLFHQLVDDRDAARYALQKLLEQDLTFRPEILLQLGFLFAPDMAPDVCSLAITLAASAAAEFPSDWNDSQILQMMSLIRRPPETSAVRTAVMIAQARLFSLLHVHHCSRGDFETFWSNVRTCWVVEVKEAAGSDMDTQVRLHAAEALSGFLPSLPRCQPEPATMSLLITLRDLLNDDDEEVRLCASQTATIFINSMKGFLSSELFNCALCPQAINFELEEYLLLNSSRLPDQFSILLGRLLGTPLEVDVLEFLRESSVQHQVRRIYEEARGLFVVERQNLYVDELDEARFWVSLCKANGKEQRVPLARSFELELRVWIVDGLNAVQDLLDGVGSSPALPTTIFDLDMLLLCVRVVGITSVYLALSTHHFSDQTSRLRREEMLKKLQRLQKAAKQSHAHPRLTCSIAEALKSVEE